MRKLPLALLVVFLGLSPLACSGDDDPTGLPTGDPELAAMVGCMGEGLVHIALAVETGYILYHVLDDPTYTPPAGFSYLDEAGTFFYSRHLGTYGENGISGEIDPVSVVEDGLQQGDNFAVTWWIIPAGELDVVAGGGFRTIHLGLTLPPDQTETMRMIPSSDIWVDTGGMCHVDVTQFEIIVHHLDTDAEMQTLLVTFTAIHDTNQVTGYMTAGGDVDVANISTTWDGENYACDFDLDTYDVDCYPV